MCGERPYDLRPWWCSLRDRLVDGALISTEEGTPQGGPISPVLSNIYPHFTLDLWFEKIQSTVPGRGILGALRIFDVASVFVDSYGPFGDLFVHLLEDVVTTRSIMSADLKI